jgi:pyruvate ferredoxin oxidoreductase beta subunit
MNKRWKKNMAAMMAVGHPGVRYVATGCGSYAVDLMNKIRKALEIGGPTFIHTYDPCPKGWDYDPMYSHELGMLGVETGIWVQYEVIDGEISLNGPTRMIARGKRKRKPVYEFLKRQGRFAHFNDEDVDYFQAKVDEMWEKWWLPGILPIWPEEGLEPTHNLQNE